MRLKPIRFLHTEGNYSEIGKAIGKAQKKEIISLLDSIIIKKEVKAMSEKALIRHKKAFPDFVRELKGIANGAGVDFLSLFAFNCFEDKISFKNHEEKCTTIFWPDKKGGFIGHNEEEFGFNYGKLLLVHATIKGKGSFVSLNYPGILCGDSISINSHGLLHSIDTIYPLKVYPNGYARSFIGRALLESSSLKQTKQVLTKFPNFEGLYILAYSKNEKKCIGIETYGNKTSTMNLGNNPYVHSNHYISAKFRDIPQDFPPISLFKVKRAHELLGRYKRKGVKVLGGILSDHNEFPLSICRHPLGDSLETTATLAAVVISLSDFSFYVANGNPCENELIRYRL